MADYSELEEGKQERCPEEEETLEDVFQPRHFIKWWWEVVRIVAYWMLTLSVSALGMLIFLYMLVYSLATNPDVLNTFVFPLKFALGSTLYLLVILCPDVIRVLRIISRQVWRNCAVFSVFVCVIGGIVAGLVGLGLVIKLYSQQQLPPPLASQT